MRCNDRVIKITIVIIFWWLNDLIVHVHIQFFNKQRQFVPLNEKFNCNQGHKKLLCTAVIELRSKLTSCMHSPSLQTQYPLGELKIIYCLHSYSKPVQAFPAYHKIPLCGPSLWHEENTSSSSSKLYSEIHLGTRTLFLHVLCTLLILKQINAQIFLSFW